APQSTKLPQRVAAEAGLLQPPEQRTGPGKVLAPAAHRRRPRLRPGVQRRPVVRLHADPSSSVSEAVQLGRLRRPAPPPLTAQGHPRAIFKKAIGLGNVLVAEARGHGLPSAGWPTVPPICA